MSAKVSYKQGTKKTYKSLPSHLSNALYFCTDTKELFKGDDLYSDGLRLVASYSALPKFESAAEGILYYCEDGKCGYVLNAAGDGWTEVIFGVDNESVEINSSGLVAVKAVPVGKVAGLSEKLQEIDKKSLELETRLTAVEQAAVPVVQYTFDADQFDTTDDNVSIKDVDGSIVTYNGRTIVEWLNELMNTVSWEDMAATVDAEASGVQDAVSGTDAGSVIRLKSGMVQTAVNINKSVTVAGSNMGVPQNYDQEV